MKIMKYFVAALAVAAPATQASAERLFGLTSTGTIVTFDSASAGMVTSSGAIAGVAAGDTLTGIDLRPSNRTLYSIATSGNIYQIVKDAVGTGYTATLTGDARPAGNLNGTRFGVDFNPVPDRLRVVTDFDQNLRINVDNGATTVDGNITGPGSISLVGAAYTNNRPGVTTTTLYGLDASGNELLRSTNPNAGTYELVGAIAGMDFGGNNNVGFDISGRSGTAFVSNGAQLFTINLGTAQTTALGTIGAGSLVGLTAAGGIPEPTSWALMIGGFGLVGGLARRRTARRPAELIA